MKIYNYILMGMLALSMAACEKENLDIPNSPNTDVTPEGEKGEENEEKKDTVFLKINPVLEGYKQSRANIINGFSAGQSMLVKFLDKSAKYTFTGNYWESETPLVAENTSKVIVFYPYMEFKDPENSFIDLSAQEDLLWGSEYTSYGKPAVNIKMNHLLALVRVKILRDQYLGEGKITGVHISNTSVKPKFSVSQGLVRNDFNLGNLYSTDEFTLSGHEPGIAEIIVAPKYSGSSMSINFMLDGKLVSFPVSEYHKWDAGMIYTYTLKIKSENNGPIAQPDAPVDVEFWEHYGKTDKIEIQVPDSNDREKRFTYDRNSAHDGRDYYQNEGTLLKIKYKHWGRNSFNGKVRLVLTQNGKIVEQFQPMIHNPKFKESVYTIPVYITANPGTYNMELFFQKEGETTWFRGRTKGPKEEYLIKVLPPADINLPSMRDAILEGQEHGWDNLILSLPDKDPFKVTYILTNNGENNIRGEIKAVWEREFKLDCNTFYPSWKHTDGINDNEWADEIGRATVEIPAGVRFWKNQITCKIPVAYPAPRHKQLSQGSWYCSPVIFFYWKAEGSSEWKLIRTDFSQRMSHSQDQSADKLYRNNIICSLESWSAK